MIKFSLYVNNNWYANGDAGTLCRYAKELSANGDKAVITDISGVIVIRTYQNGEWIDG